ncbi:LOW QUALITY PROTEIN: glutaredoxin domain-containing cysteine-rich protein 1-like, partial [Gigantopelta aegis]|uniref:LOW QUALITY PROTEIN: glutaredoxin domain-containing cysteine-rich protein 1-like n=1 Tax=Gigantopelta aegis TaxID=1735272 RepID=UPI001B88C8DD
MADTSKKESYAGIRDLKNPAQIQEEDIISSDGTLMGKQNRRFSEENKIVIYTTTFRGVRTTFEECKYLLSLFHNHRVKVEERMSTCITHFYRELEQRLDGKVVVPQVFINGQHIGGKEKVEELNELGELRKLLENFPKIDTLKKCSMCAGYEFVPCLKCGGSKNSVVNNFTSEFRALKCTSCNENGLQLCPQ